MAGGRTGGGDRRQAGTKEAGRGRGARAGAATRRRSGAPEEAPPATSGAIELFGHQVARAEVAAAHAAGTLAPVLLVTGPRGVGKESFAFWVARLVLCTAAEGRPCGRCPSCTRIARLQHPDVHWFFPVPSESGFDENDWAKLLQRIREEPLNPLLTRFTQPASFRMHQAGEIRRLAATKSFEGAGRVFILADYEQNPSDQVHNALLKVLEEPPPRTTFVLTTARPQGLPATILSRCRRVRLAPLSRPEMEAFLEAAAERRGEPIGPRELAEALGLAEGRPGRALELIVSQDDPAMEDAVDLLRAVVEGGVLGSYGWAGAKTPRGSREEHERRLDALGILWRDLLRVGAGVVDGLVRPDLLDLYRSAAHRLDPARGAAASLEIERGREQIRANALAMLVFWRLFRELALAFEKGAPRSRPPRTGRP